MDIAVPPTDDDIADWKYDMRREMQIIVPNLFLGPYSVARDKAVLLANNITHLLCCLDANESRIMRAVFPDFQYKFIQVSDSLSENLIPYFPAARDFLQEALSSPKNRVLVYCNNGLSRSPSFVVAFLMEALHWDFLTAYGYVQNRRFCISPNENFKTQLREYQPIYQARLSGSHGTVGGEGVAGATHAKRRQHEEDDLLADHYADHDHDPDFGGDGGMRDADMATVE